MTPLIIILIVLAVIVGGVILAYNGLVKLRQRVKEAWSDIDVQLKRRYDLIPNLVDTVKGYAKHEKEVFENVTKARNQAMNAGTLDEQADAENQLSGALKSLFAVSEDYPDLKANENFLELQRELTDTENKIQASRRFYNNTVMSLNTKVETFPSNIIANAFGFHKEDYFEIEDESQREAVNVSF